MMGMANTPLSCSTTCSPRNQDSTTRADGDDHIQQPTSLSQAEDNDNEKYSFVDLKDVNFNNELECGTMQLVNESINKKDFILVHLNIRGLQINFNNLILFVNGYK